MRFRVLVYDADADALLCFAVDAPTKKAAEETVAGSSSTFTFAEATTEDEATAEVRAVFDASKPDYIVDEVASMEPFSSFDAIRKAAEISGYEVIE